MTLYEEYKEKYNATIALNIAAGNAADYIVKDYYWITVKFLEDRNIFPWEFDKMQELIIELLENNENKMVETIEKTLNEFIKTKKENKKE